MGNLAVLASAAASLLVVTACGNDSASVSDAPAAADAPAADAPAADAPAADAPVTPANYDLSCYQNQAPTTATDPLTLSGTVREVVLMGISPTVRTASGVSLAVCTGDCQGQARLDTQGPTAAAGTFTTADLATGGVPLDGHVRATKTGNWPSYIYPASPITADLADVPVFMFSNTVISALPLVGITQTAGNAIVGMMVTDCATPPKPITGATVSVTQNGSPVGDAPYDASSLDPQAAGTFIVFNVPPGASTVVSATYNGMTFRAHTVAAVADTTTMTQIRPGF